MTKLYIWVQ